MVLHTKLSSWQDESVSTFDFELMQPWVWIQKVNLLSLRSLISYS